MPRLPKYMKTNPHIKEAAFGRLHKGGGRPSAARPLCGIPYGWVCGGWEGISRGEIMPNCAGIVAAKWYFAKWYLAAGYL